jgi:hypothetical protein
MRASQGTEEQKPTWAGRISAFSANTGTRSKVRFKEHSMTNNKDPNQKQPGEKEPGTFHYNPGNMSGKTIGANKEEPQHPNDDRIGPDQQDKKTKKPSIANE